MKQGDNVGVLFKLFGLTVIFFILTLMLETYHSPPSRRLANSTYIAWIVSEKYTNYILNMDASFQLSDFLIESFGEKNTHVGRLIQVSYCQNTVRGEI